MKRQIQLVITDLDNTIWDWFKMWYCSFNTLLQGISDTFGVDKDILISDFKQLHQKYHSTEASYIIDELNSISIEEKKAISNLIMPSGRTILHEYYSAKKNKLDVYDGVIKFLGRMKDYNVKVVGFTESNSFFTKYRIKHLGLENYFSAIYAPADFELPDSVKKIYPDDYWESSIQFTYLPQKTKKPNPEILNKIISDYGIDKNNVVYIGDKVDRDILMANQAGVLGVYAKYGDNVKSDKYELLKSVTHWSDEEVQREIEARKTDCFGVPDIVLNSNIMEIFEQINFDRT